MQVVDASLGRRFAETVQQMPKVMQESCRDKFVVSALAFCQCSALQRVFQLRDRLAAIRDIAVLLKQGTNIIQIQSHAITPKVKKMS
jgi:hypothetical protein